MPFLLLPLVARVAAVVAVVYTWPVAPSTPIVDRFRPPPTPYAAGNRGIDFDTDVGQPVVAAAPGEVVFAGAIGHPSHVVVLHADGLRTSYSFLHEVSVRRGERVGRGAMVGRAGDTLHFGVRRGDEYLDPLTVLNAPGHAVHAYLVSDRDRPLARDRWFGRLRAGPRVGPRVGPRARPAPAPAALLAGPADRPRPHPPPPRRAWFQRAPA